MKDYEYFRKRIVGNRKERGKFSMRLEMNGGRLSSTLKRATYFQNFDQFLKHQYTCKRYRRQCMSWLHASGQVNFCPHFPYPGSVGADEAPVLNGGAPLSRTFLLNFRSKMLMADWSKSL